MSPVQRKARGRPPKSTESGLSTREWLIRCGTEMLTEHGFVSTGIDPVLRRAGVPKGSFYHYFDSKEAFGQAVIESYAAYFARKLDRLLGDVSILPLARLRAFVADARQGMARYDFRRGCLVGNLGQEVGGLSEIVRVRLEAIFSDWEARVAACLREAQARGELAAEADCRQLAAFFWIGWEGAILRAKLVRSAAPLDLFADGFFAALPRP